MNLRDFMKITPEERERIFNKPIGTCAYLKCGKSVTQFQEHQYVPAGVFHEDCYWAEFDDVIEKYPIHTPRRRGIGRIMLNQSDLENMAGVGGKG